MVNTDADTNRTWKMRLGKGSNMYSFIGAYGESVPPQWNTNGGFVDEVWQNVVVAQGNDELPDAKWFIPQAGTYAWGNRTMPFFSPNVAKYFEGSQCSSASWGLPSKLPTKFWSSAIYLNWYTDCGNGVVELTSAIHNAAARTLYTTQFHGAEFAHPPCVIW